MKETNFSDAEFASEKRLMRRERFPAEIEVATPWPALVAMLLPYYPKGDGRGRPPMGLERMLRMYIAQQCFGFVGQGNRGCNLRQPVDSRFRWHRSDARIGGARDAP